MRQFVYTMFISNSCTSFHLRWKGNMVKHQKVSKYYKNDCSCSLQAVQWRGWLHYECLRISTLKYCQYHTGHLIAFRKTAIKLLARCKVCSNLTSVLQQLAFVLLVPFFNLEHLSHSTLVLLFTLWKGKCWLKVRRERFVKIIQWC